MERDIMPRASKGAGPSGFAEEGRPHYDTASPVAPSSSLRSPDDYEGQNGVPVTPEKFRNFRLRMEPNGRVVIPAELRALWTLPADGQLTARFRNGELVLSTPVNGMRLAQAILAPFRKEGRSVVDELIAERREESRREEAEAAEWLARRNAREEKI
jgi:bifunctional DNA-binding transcriptional regulator/antitoxin component of YhaV-PrlF toxin-antitoxin module